MGSILECDACISQEFEIKSTLDFFTLGLGRLDMAIPQCNHLEGGHSVQNLGEDKFDDQRNSEI